MWFTRCCVCFLFKQSFLLLVPSCCQLQVSTPTTADACISPARDTTATPLVCCANTASFARLRSLRNIEHSKLPPTVIFHWLRRHRASRSKNLALFSRICNDQRGGATRGGRGGAVAVLRALRSSAHAAERAAAHPALPQPQLRAAAAQVRLVQLATNAAEHRS